MKNEPEEYENDGSMDRGHRGRNSSGVHFATLPLFSRARATDHTAPTMHAGSWNQRVSLHDVVITQKMRLS